MTTAHAFNGPDGMARKIRLLASNCETATAGLSRTLLIAVSSPDPVSTPDCEHAAPRGIRIQTLDKGMTSTDIAVLMGTLYGMLDTIEHEYVRCRMSANASSRRSATRTGSVAAGRARRTNCSPSSTS